MGDIDIELWSKEAPKACRNFVQLCMEGYYDNTIFHRVIKGFIAQGGDPEGTGLGGESIYGKPFKDEFHSRLRLVRRGLVAMANAGKDDNGSQFFFTLGPCTELQNKHTVFGKVTGATLYNIIKLEEGEIGDEDRPLFPHKITGAEVLMNPFEDIVPRVLKNKDAEVKDGPKSKMTATKNFNLLSFGEEAEEDEDEIEAANIRFTGKSKSSHDLSNDPKLSSEPAVEVKTSKKRKHDSVSKLEDVKSEPPVKTEPEEKTDLLQNVKDKLKQASSKLPKLKKNDGKKAKEVNQEVESDSDEGEYYLGKDQEEERKKKMKEIKAEIRNLRKDMKDKSDDKSHKDELEEEQPQEEDAVKAYKEQIKKYQTKKQSQLPKGTKREQETMALLNAFKEKLAKAKENVADGEKKTETKEEEEIDDENDESWMSHALNFEDDSPVVAKDANTKSDDWFEIYDPRHRLNKRRRGEDPTKEQMRKKQY